MKRSQDFVPASPSQEPPLQKKLKLSPDEPATLTSVPFQSTSTMPVNSEEGWTKVEKRKAKKMRKHEVKLDVCVSQYVQ